MAVYNWHDPLARSVDAAIFVNNLFQYEVLRMRSWISYHKVCLLMFYKKFRDYSFCHRNAYLWVTYVVIDILVPSHVTNTNFWGGTKCPSILNTK